MKGFVSAILLMVMMMLPASGSAAQLYASPQVLEAAIALFPEALGPYELRFKGDIRLHTKGFEIMNYTMLVGGREAGTVSHIRSIIKDGPASEVDILARFDENGRLIGVRDLLPAEGRDKRANVFGVTTYFVGTNPRELSQAVTIVSEALATASGSLDIKAPPQPLKDFVLNLEQKILTPGAKLPALKMEDIEGKTLDTSREKGKLIMVFVAPTCARCLDMAKAIEKGLDASGKRKKVTTAYIISSDAESAKQYAAQSGMQGRVFAEPGDQVSNLFQVPFKPYALMFDNGELKYLTAWEDESKMLGYMYLLIEGKEPGR